LNYDYDVFGITSTTPTIVKAWKLAKNIKKNNPNCSIILGGPHPTALPEESLNHEGVDVIVRGEGEETIKEVCEKLEKRKSLIDVKGISYKDSGKIRHNISRPYIENLDKIPFPRWDLFDVKKYQPIQPLLTNRKSMNIMTSRGCPYNCNFCFKEIFGRKYRMRSVENIVEEWRILVEKYKVEEIGIQDDLFNFDKKRVIDFCKNIRSEGLDVLWCTPNGIRADHADKEVLINMKKAGCYRISYGVENGNQNYLDNVVGKCIKLEQIRVATKLARNLKFKIGASFVLGNIKETISTMKQTIDFACSLPIDYALFSIATPYPVSRMYLYVIKNCKLLVKSWEEYSAVSGKCYFECENLTKDIVENMFKYAYRRFYLRYSHILSKISDINNWENMMNLVEGVIHYIGGR
jgi:radical SAM superfamily enzyme YgiQ (UPF0313 family)